jgi:hypothetical protein
MAWVVTNWHVSPTGNAASPGTLNAPTSLTNAVAANTGAQPGDVIWMAGTWTDFGCVVHVSGTAGNPITFKPEPNSTAILDGVAASNIVLSIASRSYLVFDGLKFDNNLYLTKTANWQGIILRACSYIQFKNCTFTHMQMLLYGCDHCTIGDASANRQNISNTWSDFCPYVKDVNGVYQPQTSGDMIGLFTNTIANPHVACTNNLIQGNDMTRAGHSCVSVGDGLGNGAVGTDHANNTINENNFHNTWYRNVALCDTGTGTVLSNNNLTDATSQPFLYSTVPGQVGAFKTSSNSLQLTGAKNYSVFNNYFANNVSTYGTIDLGSHWYQQGTWYLCETMNNTIYSNVFKANFAPGDIAFVQLWAPGAEQSFQNGAGVVAPPRLTGNVIHDNIMSQGAGTVYDYTANPQQSATGTALHYAIMMRGTLYVPAWTGLNGNSVYNNQLDTVTGNIYMDDVVYTPGPNQHIIKSLAQFNGFDANTYGNTLYSTSQAGSVLVTGLGTAQSFGAISIHTGSVIIVISNGLHSAQAFGSPTIKTATKALLSGLTTSQMFGTITVIGNVIIVSRLVGIPSGQSFGLVTAYGAQQMIPDTPTSGTDPDVADDMMIALGYPVDSADRLSDALEASQGL